jgi:predicted TIM-barrel fold metal-dependent hydrolase
MSHVPSNDWVDTHFHVFHANEAVIGARYMPPYDARLVDWQAQAKTVGITHGVCVQPSFLGQDNSLMLRALSAQPDRLRGVAVVDVHVGPQKMHDMHAKGVRGIRLNLAGISHDVHEWTHAETVWQTMRTLGWHLEVHTNQGMLAEVLHQLPSDIALVVDHMGKPESASLDDRSIRTVLTRAKHAPTYIKLSGAYRLGQVDAKELATLWLHELGPHALFWGSDWPCTNHEKEANHIKLFAQLVDWVGEERIEALMQHNPKRFYWADTSIPR